MRPVLGSAAVSGNLEPKDDSKRNAYGRPPGLDTRALYDTTGTCTEL